MTKKVYDSHHWLILIPGDKIEILPVMPGKKAFWISESDILEKRKTCYSQIIIPANLRFEKWKNTKNQPRSHVEAKNLQIFTWYSLVNSKRK